MSLLRLEQNLREFLKQTTAATAAKPRNKKKLKGDNRAAQKQVTEERIPLGPGASLEVSRKQRTHEAPCSPEAP
jgi:hypothetical protein